MKYNSLKILNKKEKQEIENKLKEQFGIKEIPGLLIKKGRERVFLFSGNLQIGEIRKLEKIVPIERIGIYFAKIINDKIKLSIEGTHLLKSQIKKNIFELNKSQTEEWMLGKELLVENFSSDQKRAGGWGSWKGKNTGEFLVMKYGNDFLGCGKASENKIGNFIPKSRRLKERG